MDPLNARQNNPFLYFFAARNLARHRDWERLNELLDNNKEYPLITHDAVDAAFFNTAIDGRADLVQKMFAQGFMLRHSDDTIDALCLHHVHSLDIIAASGNVRAMSALKDAGVDIFNGTSVFFLAFFSNRPEMMTYLQEQGACLYNPNLLKGLYDRKDEAGPAAIAFYKTLIQQDGERSLAYLKTLPQGGLKDTVNTQEGTTTTRMHLAAKAGVLLDTACVFTASDLLKKDDCGETVLSIMAARGERGLALAPQRWAHAPEDLLRLYDSLREVQAAEGLDVKETLAQIKALAPALGTLARKRAADKNRFLI